MSNQFSDIQIIECNRLHSEEAKGSNNENTSLWTNNLQDILLLEPGDQVSVYQSFISERGAGQGETVEIKGVELGPEVEIQYINASKTRLTDSDLLDDDLPSQCSKQVAEYKNEKFKLRDDTLRFTINYYMVANAMNSMHLPRRFMYSNASARVNYTTIDSITQGATRLKVDFANSTTTRGYNYYQGEAFYTLLLNGDGDHLKKPKNDNARYTLMMRDKTHFTYNSAFEDDDMPIQDMRDPENATYYTFRDLKTFTLPAGFNSPEFIATELSRQFQSITNDKALYQQDADTAGSVRGGRYPIAVSKLLESETYKAFFTGNVFDNSKDNFLYYFNLTGTSNSSTDRGTRASWDNLSGFEYLRQYNVVACKYPELYETGRLLNRNSAQVYQGIKGAEVKTNFRTADGTAKRGIEIDIPYSKARCDEFKAFFDAQKLYPEIINNLNSGFDHIQLGYAGNNNSINNTRWMHMNRWDYNVQSLAATPLPATTQLGWGGYYEPRHSPLPASTQLSSFLIMLYFDPDQENTFYTSPDTDGLEQYTYGCLGRSDDGNIMIYPTRHVNNGFTENPDMWSDELMTTAVPGVPGAKMIEAGRKVGFDMHFGAPGMYWMLPLCGWTDRPDPQSSYASLGGDFVVPNIQQDNKAKTGTYTDLNPWKKLLYIGADQPSLDWDGSFFSFSGFHTGMNRGNDDQNGNPIFPDEKVDERAADTVYFINPPNYNNDFTPDRTPYSFDKYNLSTRLATSGTLIEVAKLNTNLEAWRVYDMLCGIFIDNFATPEENWDDSLWGILGFTYAQFHGTNNRLVRVDKKNANDLSLLTTNAEVVEGDTKIFHTNWAGTPIYKNMITTPANIYGWNAANTAIAHNTQVYPQIIHETKSISIVADRLPTRMIRGYYTIRSNILSDTPFVGGKVNNTTMPIIGTVNKINNYGDFVFGEESNLTFTVTKPLRLASITCSVHDPDGSYARTDKQSTILFKITKTKVAQFDVAQEILETLGARKGEQYLENLGVI